MLRSLSLCLLALVLLVSVEAQFEEEGILVLNEKNFDSTIARHSRILVEFYVPWCGHSKRLAPEYAKAARILKSNGQKVPLAKVDASVDLDLSFKYDVQGFPTLKYFIDGVPIDYTGGRSDVEIVDWVTKRTGAFSRSVASVSELENIIKANSVVGVFVGQTESDGFKSFMRAAMGFNDISFVNSESPEVKAFVGVEGASGIALFKRFDEGKVIYKGEFNDTEILEFFDREEYPTVMYFNQKTAEKVFGRNLETLFVIGSEGQTDKEVASLKEVSQKLKGKIELVYSYVNDGLGMRLANFFELQESDLPAARILRFEGEDIKKFKPVYSELTAENLFKFFQDFKSGRSKSSFKTEPTPRSNYGNIKIVVGSTFDQIVMDPTKNVLLYLYAPWCAACRTVETALESLAAKSKSNKDLVFAKMDATANEVEGVAVPTFPTIRYYPANDKNKPIDFNGEKTEKALSDFLKKPTPFPFGKIDL